MKNILNYIGQFRIYSLVDLILLLWVTGANNQEFWGIILLHLGFLALLENMHSHSYRKKMPKWLWIVLTVLGIIFYRHWEVIPFIFFSYLYTKKTGKYFGMFCSLFRGLQYFFLIGGIIGYNNQLVWVALIAIFIRNFIGDLRDVEKDKKENMMTLPITLGFKKDIKKIHLLALLSTSLIWWSFSNFSIWIILPIFVIEILTYNLTPR